MTYSSFLALALATSGIQNGDVPVSPPVEQPAELDEYIAQDIGLPEALKEYHLTYDASLGFDHAIPMIASITYRGENAEEVRRSVAEKGKEQALADIKAGLKTDNKRIDAMTLDMSETDDSVTVRMTGVVEMSWIVRAETNRLSSDFINDIVAFDVDPVVDARWKDDESLTLDTPFYRKMTQVIILPRNGEGFSIEGHDLNMIVANTEITRSLSLIDGRAIAITTNRRIEPEITVPAWRTAVPVLQALDKDLAYIIAPKGYVMTNEELEVLKKEEPISAQFFFNRGYQYFYGNEIEKALADFRKAKEMAPDWTDIQGYEALSLLYLDKLGEAEAALAKIGDAGENDWVVQLAAGSIEAAKADGDLNRARDALTRALAIYPQSDLAYYARSTVYGRLGQYDQMRADLEKVLELSPAHYGATRYLAYLDAWQGKSETAISMADKVIADYPDSPDGYVIKADLLRRFGHSKEARTFYEKGIKAAIEGDTSQEWTDWDDTKWQALMALGQTGRSVRLADKELRRDPENADLLSTRCWVRGVVKAHLEKALKDCEKAVRLAPQDKDLVEGPGFIRYQQGRFLEAIAAFDQAITKSPLSPGAHLLRGFAKLETGDKSGGEADILRAKSLVFDIEEAYADYGIVRPH